MTKLANTTPLGLKINISNDSFVFISFVKTSVGVLQCKHFILEAKSVSWMIPNFKFSVANKIVSFVSKKIIKLDFKSDILICQFEIRSSTDRQFYGSALTYVNDYSPTAINFTNSCSDISRFVFVISVTQKKWAKINPAWCKVGRQTLVVRVSFGFQTWASFFNIYWP